MSAPEQLEVPWILGGFGQKRHFLPIPAHPKLQFLLLHSGVEI